MFDGIKWTGGRRAEADIAFASGALAQMLRHGSGFDTLYISGSFTERRPGARVQLGRNFVLPRGNEVGQFFHQHSSMWAFCANISGFAEAR
jgi:hypothetical protein